MSYKSTRLLVEAIHGEMANLKKQLMAATPSPDNDQAQDSLTELRKLIDELETRANRPSIDDVVKLAPADYVATMKPLVGMYHRLLMNTGDLLASCICEDLSLSGCALLLIGEGKTSVRTAYDPAHPETAIAIEALIQTIDKGMAQVVTEGVAEAEKQLGIEVPVNPLLESVEADKAEKPEG